MTANTLQFVHSARRPTDDLRVFDSLTRPLLGAEFTFRVIGSSHYVSAPAYDFHELSSCEPVECDDAATLRLDGPTTADTEADTDIDGAADAPPVGADGGTGPRRRIDYAADGLACATVVERRPLAAFSAEASFDLAYRFGPDALTTVDVRADGYETYHTYPEFDLALYTRTVFENVPGGVADGRTGFSSDSGVDRTGDRPGQPTD